MPDRIALTICAVLAALVIGPRGPVYWDSFGYVAQAIHGHVGGLALGRPSFVLISHQIIHLALFLRASIWSAEPLLRASWLIVSTIAAPAAYTLALDAGLSRRGALIAGLSVGVSPAMAHTSATVLTDGPAAAMVLVSLALGARAVTQSNRWTVAHAFLAGATLGIAVGLREQSIFFAASLALMIPVADRTKRLHIAVAMLVGIVIFTAVPIAYVMRTEPGYVHSIAVWIRAMQRERATQSHSPRDLLFYFAWLVALGPAVLVGGVIAWSQHRAVLLARWSVLLAITVPSVIQLLALALYQDISYSPRYLLSAFPCALAIPAALAFDEWIEESARRGIIILAALMVPTLIAAPFIHRSEAPLHRTLEALPAALLSIPARSVIVSGQPCPAIMLIQTQFRTEPINRDRVAQWQTVCPGWSWPPSLDARLDTARTETRTVVLDLRESSWLGAGQRARMNEAMRYRDQHEIAVQQGQIVIWR